MSVLVFLDLDDTLFQTLKKCPPGADLEVAAVNSDGTPGSFMTRKQRALIDWLLATTDVVPTTGRNLSAFQRVLLPFSGRAILNHGGTIVDARGEPDLGWYDVMDPVLIPAALADLASQVLAQGTGVRARVIGDHGRMLYLSVKHPDVDMAALDRAGAFLARAIDPSMRIISSANNLAVIPRALSKGRAVRRVIEARGAPDELVFGFGDTPSDLGYLATCDFAALPHKSVLARALHDAARPGAGLGEHEP